MKVHGWGQRGNYPLPPSKTDPETGKRLCRWCEFPVPQGRVYWCGEICVEEYNLRANWNHLRDHIIARDREKGCALCRAQRYHVRGGFGHVMRARSAAMLFRYREVRDVDFWGEFTAVARGWEVDHIRPVIEGGTDEPLNLRLLCVPCHRDVTRQWRRGRADDSRQGSLLD